MATVPADADPSGYPDVPSLAHKESENKIAISKIQVDGASLQGYP